MSASLSPDRETLKFAMECPFHVLQLPKWASLSDIDKQWKAMVRVVHPDKIGAADGTAKTQALNDAHERAREMYDKTGLHCLTIMSIVRQLHYHEFDKRKSSYDSRKFDAESSQWSPEDRKEAENMIQYGLNGRYNERILEAQLEKEKTNAYAAEQRAKGAELKIQQIAEMLKNAEKNEEEQVKKTAVLMKECAAKDQKIQALEAQIKLIEKNAYASLAAVTDESERKTNEVNALLATEITRANEAEEKVSEITERMNSVEKTAAENAENTKREASISMENAMKEATALRLECDTMAAKIQTLEAQQIEVQGNGSPPQNEDALVHKTMKCATSVSSQGIGMEKNVHDFVKNCIVAADESTTISTKQLASAFKGLGHFVDKLETFAIVLSKQVRKIHPTGKAFRNSSSRGYSGITLKDLE